jgi:hypothetical protein
MWMTRNYAKIPFERYADDAICHCQTREQAEYLKTALEKRFQECGLELNAAKTKIYSRAMKVAEIRITEAILSRLSLLSLVNFNAREYSILQEFVSKGKLSSSEF